MEFLIVLAALALVTLFVTRPLWRVQNRGWAGVRPPGEMVDAKAPGPGPAPDAVAELEAAREAKYREIRDAELDRRTGKLSQDDYETVDRSLRAEAVEILKALDVARERLPSST